MSRMHFFDVLLVLSIISLYIFVHVFVCRVFFIYIFFSSSKKVPSYVVFFIFLVVVKNNICP